MIDRTALRDLLAGLVIAGLFWLMLAGAVGVIVYYAMVGLAA